MTTLDSFIRSKGGIRVDFMKVDAEGKDRDVLEGAKTQIEENLSVFTFECAPCALKEKEFHRFDELGYSCYSLTKAGSSYI